MNFLEWLRKPVASRQLVPQMEGLRFVALWAVFFLHFDQAVTSSFTVGEKATAADTWLGSMCGVGDFGVQLFFTISGFVLALPFARWRLLEGRAISIKRYFFRRLVRLEPPLLINLVLMIPLSVWVFHKLPLSDVPQQFAWTMGYGHRLFLGLDSPLNRVTWSLETEAQFYLTMPFLGIIFLIGNKIVRRSIFIVLGLLFVPFKESLNKALLLAQLEYFMLGLLLADLYIAEWRDKLGCSIIWDAFGALGWSAMLAVLVCSDHNSLSTAAILPACVFLAFAAALRGRLWSRVWSLPWITLCGGMCYTFYLYHDPVIKLSSGVLKRLMSAHSYYVHFFAWLVVVLPLTLIISVICYSLFERPFMRTAWKISDDGRR